jgi:hypothetical protein
MQPFALKTYSPGVDAPPSAFFILSRGRNTGRPAFTPNANCFVFTCAPQDLTAYYWLIYTLWVSRKFRDILKGTCIEFARIGDVRQLIAENAPRLENIGAVVGSLQKLQALEIKFKKQLRLIEIARKGLLKVDNPSI